MEPWISVGMSALVVALFATLWAFEAVQWFEHRDTRALLQAVAASMVVVGTLGIFALSLHRAGIISYDVRVWLIYLTRGALLLGGAMLLSVKISKP